MYNTVYPMITLDTKGMKYKKRHKVRNENIVKFLAERSPFTVAADIHSCSEVQKSLRSADIIIANVLRLHENNVVFTAQNGGKEWTITNKIDPSTKVKKFVKPEDFYEWLQRDEVEDFIDSRIEGPLPAAIEQDAKSRDHNGRQNSSRNNPQKRKDPEDNDPGTGDDRKDNAKHRKRRRKKRGKKKTNIELLYIA